MKNNNQIITDIKRLSNPSRARISQRFFKTGKGDYGEGDVFWGLTVPECREIATQLSHYRHSGKRT
jgi:hypothetical protein